MLKKCYYKTFYIIWETSKNTIKQLYDFLVRIQLNF